MDTTRKKVLTLLGSANAVAERRLIVLERTLDLHNCTQGEIVVGNKVWDTLELPWKQNRKNISRIPPGTYTFQKIKRMSTGANALWLRDVEKRTEILIHQGTKPTHSQGCILIRDYEAFHKHVQNKGLIVII